MSRHLATNAELTDMINERFSEGKEPDGDCRDIRITPVYLLAPDECNCNWDVGFYNGPEACRGVFRLIVKEFRKQYNLKEERGHPWSSNS